MILELGLTLEELKALEKVNTALTKIYMRFSGGTCFEGVDTGEVIQVKELSRTLGILSGFQNEIMWKIRHISEFSD